VQQAQPFCAIARKVQVGRLSFARSCILAENTQFRSSQQSQSGETLAIILKTKKIDMRHLKVILFFSFVLSTLNSVAQKSNSDKILGCWEFKEIKFSEEVSFAEELIENARNTFVCFSSDGKFTSTKDKTTSKIISGSYQISEDGKTLIQKRDLPNDGVDENAEIDFLDDKLLIFKLEFGTMSFERK
jgi:hypothetical protein